MDFLSRLIELKIIPFIKKWNLVGFIIGVVDILAIAIAFQLSYFINYFETGGYFFSQKGLLIIFLGILPLWLITLYILKATEIPRTKRYRVLFIEYMESAVIVALILLVFYFLFRNYIISRRVLVEFTFLGFLFLFFVRLFEYNVFKVYRAKGFNYAEIVLIADETSIPFIEKLESYPEWGYRIILIFTNSGKLNEKYRSKYKILPDRLKEALQEIMGQETVHEVLYIKDQINPSEIRTAIRSCEELGVTFRLMTNNLQPRLTNAFISVIADEKFLTFINVPYKPFALAVKKFMDMGISVILLLFLSPLMLIISLIIWLSSGAPIFYRQARIGLRGRPFDMYKFRTMVENADEIKGELESLNEMDGPAFKMKDDPRMTRFGRFLRSSGLDELPQLINVIRGEMSLIGPRPPLQEEIRQYKRWQLRRLSVKPGLSCFWQVKPDRNSIKFERWMEMDLAYIDNWSPRLDFLILLKTIKTVFQRTGK
jgi:exopolysaccharide biosynthesis polyprenyl glycosylphosphotransferase